MYIHICVCATIVYNIAQNAAFEFNHLRLTNKSKEKEEEETHSRRGWKRFGDLSISTQLSCRHWGVCTV